MPSRSKALGSNQCLLQDGTESNFRAKLGCHCESCINPSSILTPLRPELFNYNLTLWVDFRSSLHHSGKQENAEKSLGIAAKGHFGFN